MVDVFPFTDLSDEEFALVNSNFDTNFNSWMDLENCDLNLKTFQYTDHDSFDYENDIDIDYNCFNTVNIKCSYFTENHFKNKNKAKGDLSIIHFNCRSLSANFAHLQSYLNLDLDYIFDVITLSETWFNTSSNIDLYHIPGYDMCHIDRSDKRGGGVALYIHNSIKYSKVDKMCIAINDALECISVELKFENRRNIIVSCLYRQQGSSIDTLTDTIEQCFRYKRSDVYLCGDLNINLLNYQNQGSTRDFLDALFSLGLFPLIDRPTRITRHTASLIDNIFSNVLHSDLECGILINDVSDHLAVFSISKSNISRKKLNEYI